MPSQAPPTAQKPLEVEGPFHVLQQVTGPPPSSASLSSCFACRYLRVSSSMACFPPRRNPLLPQHRSPSAGLHRHSRPSAASPDTSQTSAEPRRISPSAAHALPTPRVPTQSLLPQRARLCTVHLFFNRISLVLILFFLTLLSLRYIKV